MKNTDITTTGKVMITRGTDKMIRISIEDSKSGSTFVEVIMTPEDFGNTITGLYVNTESKIIVKDLDVVAKQKISENRSIKYTGSPSCCYDRTKLSQWLRENAKETGYELDDYLGSKGSVVNDNGQTILYYSVFKYI